MLVPFSSLPLPALLVRDEKIVAVNAAYEDFMGLSAAEIVGSTVAASTRQFVSEHDVPVVDRATDERRSGRAGDGHLWCRVIDARGRAHAVRVVWEPSPDGATSIVYLVDAEGEAATRSNAESLARAGGDLVRCRDESEVLERTADALHARGFTVTVLLLREGDPLLAYGPTRSVRPPEQRPGAAQGRAFEALRPPRSILNRFNPHFDERRAAFFQDVGLLVAEAYPCELAEGIERVLPGRRAVQAPIFVDDAPYGALVVTSDELTPALAGTIEMFAELVARAIENVRLHQRAAARLDELQRLQGELVERERLAALGEAAAVMAHEVRNPIAALLNAVALLRRPPRDPDETGSLLSVISEEAERLERLVTDLLDLGRPLAPRLGVVDLEWLVAASVAVLQGRSECEGVELAIRRPAAQVFAVVDPDLLQLALLNVIRNAAQASPAGGRVTIEVGRLADEAAIVIDDVGSGFSDDVQRRMFEPFFTTRATGTGIGLAVVRRVVEACAGRVEIGQSPGAGGRVVLAFPAPCSGAREASAPPREPASSV